jgi:hypothetical protein
MLKDFSVCYYTEGKNSGRKEGNTEMYKPSSALGDASKSALY